jgi:hypothetical protein
MGDQPITGSLLEHRINARRHPCLEWDSNPRSQRSSERRQFIPQGALITAIRQYENGFQLNSFGDGFEVLAAETVENCLLRSEAVFCELVQEYTALFAGR